MKMMRLVLPLLLILVAVTAHAESSEPYTVIGSEELKSMIDRNPPGLLVIDARNPEEYQEVHIRGAINIPVGKLEKERSLLRAPKDATVVFYCNGVKCGKSKKSAKIAVEMGYRHIYLYAEGMPVWEEKGYPIYAGPEYEKKVETTKIPPKELKALMDGKPGTFTLVDVRDPNEYAEGHIPGAINIPVTIFAAGSGVLDKEKRIIVYCNSGGRSYNAYRKLQKLGYPSINQAIFADWEMEGLPVQK